MDKSSHVVARPRVASPDPQRTVKTLRATHDDASGRYHLQEYYEPFRESLLSLFTNLRVGHFPHKMVFELRSQICHQIKVHYNDPLCNIMC
jgi:hypothetical protein